MSALDSKSLNELLQLAFGSDVEVLEELAKSRYVNVRRAVAKNSRISTDIANLLVKDPVLNVCYMASKNPKCSLKRDFSHINDKCVLCTKDERFMNCSGCN